MKAGINFFFSCLLLFSLPVFSWNAGGHEVVAQVAYDELTPLAKKQVNYILKARFHAKYDDDRFIFAATWPDRIKGKTKKYNAWHYIGLPIIEGDVVAPPLPNRNVVWAIGHSVRIAENSHYSLKTRAKYLSFLIHFVGDVHQPMHCATLYSNKFQPPKGDLGGNRYLIQSDIARNLHAYWDRGLGLLVNRHNGNYLDYYQVRHRADLWVKKFPRRMFETQLNVASPAAWAKEGYQIAKNDAYELSENAAPSQAYVESNKVNIQKQTVLAGYRLADLLNRIFSKAS